MTRRAFLGLTAAILALAACSGEAITGLDQALYNATYSGPATLQRGPYPPIAVIQSPPPVVRFTMTTSQLGQTFSGTFALTDSTTGQQLYAGALTGKTTNTGATLTLVVPAPCPGTLYGSFTVSSTGALTGSASGRDCNATSGSTASNVQITFTNLVRQ
jgi:hypothetical protein